MITLYKRNKAGISTIDLWIDRTDQALYYAYSVVMGGATVTNSEPIVLNNSGRNFEEQAQLELESRKRRYIQRGYKESLIEAKSDTGTNQLGLPLPMLAHPIERVSDLSGKLFVQRKYDGHRCLIARDGLDIIAYSRKGTVIGSISHIEEALHKRLPSDIILDGELYCHGQSLQTIASWVKRFQPNSLKLKFHAYDLISNDSFSDRFFELQGVLNGLTDTDAVQAVETVQVDTLDDAYLEFRKYRSEGYEGAMLRRAVREYEPGRRSNQLLKIKERHDAEFEVIDVKAGKHNVGICVLKMPSGKIFDCLAPGSITEKQHVYNHRASYIGKMLTVEYAELTNDGIPFHCVAIRFREDI